jgi:hypothetical protein
MKEGEMPFGQSRSLFVWARGVSSRAHQAEEKEGEQHRRVNLSFSPKTPPPDQGENGDREKHAMLLSAVRIRDATNATATTSSGTAHHDKRKK